MAKKDSRLFAARVSDRQASVGPMQERNELMELNGRGEYHVPCSYGLEVPQTRNHSRSIEEVRNVPRALVARCLEKVHRVRGFSGIEVSGAGLICPIRQRYSPHLCNQQVLEGLPDRPAAMVGLLHAIPKTPL